MGPSVEDRFMPPFFELGAFEGAPLFDLEEVLFVVDVSFSAHFTVPAANDSNRGDTRRLAGTFVTDFESVDFAARPFPFWGCSSIADDFLFVGFFSFWPLLSSRLEMLP